MAPRLRVLAGTSASTMHPITDLVNTGTPHPLRSSVFEGSIIAYIKGFTDEHGNPRDSEYFHRSDREGVTWSIQVQGRFLVPFSSDDILFGNTFDKPLKLPWGTSAVLKFMNYIDPTLDHDLGSTTKPWALSPLVSTMPHMTHQRISLPDNTANDITSSPRTEAMSSTPFPPKTSLKDSTPDLYLTLVDESDDTASLSSGSSSASVSSKHSASSSSSSRLSSKSWRRKKRELRWDEKIAGLKNLNAGDSSKRRAYFASREKRKEVVFGPQDIITTDFCYGFISFAPSLALQLPGGLSFDLIKYWDGQPVRFVCCQRKGSRAAGEASTLDEEEDGDSDDPWGRVFWCIAIEIADDDD
ncbi:hypothetical protein CVT24_012009 [Panaeolus cyanescens]|uniref:Domain of unknown function at the cortex 1 domain-containing protein n=1 Tax=Panaeolus cyanescens TaxID=181874 RepID=A0A409YND4_9AGAR|nr:hypothetical protein CVT24_012009 [Panaeolus cyanescens]